MQKNSGEVSKFELEESCRERRHGLSKVVGPEISLVETQREIWINRPTPDTVQRLIEWFLNNGN